MRPTEWIGVAVRDMVLGRCDLTLSLQQTRDDTFDFLC
jgi:hypothetical protein